MVIHVVQSEETIYSIADQYGVSAERLIQDNDLENLEQLVVGQAILIVSPNQTHTVREGDTLSGIAEGYGITVLQLLRNNPFLIDREAIYLGETLVISYADDKSAAISVNGYAYPYIENEILNKNLLFLTYLSIFSYTITEDGELSDIDDTRLINLAKAYGVAPIMVISTVTDEENIDRNRLHNLLVDPEARNSLAANILSVLKEKGYYGLNFDFPYIPGEDRQLFFDFVSAVRERFNSEGFKVFVTVTPSSFEIEPEASYEIVDFSRLGQIVDGIVLLSYSWGHATEVPPEAFPSALFEAILEYISTQIPPEKLMIGISSIGYIWPIPYIVGVTRANAISNTNAVQLASDAGAEIYYNPNNQTAYFYIRNEEVSLVYFHDIRGVDASLTTTAEHSLQGVAIWNIMYYQAQTFLLINSQYEINSVPDS